MNAGGSSREGAEMKSDETRRSEDVAFSRLAAIGPSPAERARNDEIQRGIDQSMAQTIREAGYNPNALGRNFAVTPAAGAVVTKPDPWEDASYNARLKAAAGPGWSEPKPLVTPQSAATDEHIRRLADHFAPHGPASPLRTGGVPLIPGGPKEEEEPTQG